MLVTKLQNKITHRSARFPQHITLLQVHPDGKFVVDLDKSIEMSQVTPNLRVALRNDSYTLHKILPSKIDPLVSLMMVEKVPDSTYDMVGGLDKQIKEIKEVSIRQIYPVSAYIFECRPSFAVIIVF